MWASKAFAREGRISSGFPCRISKFRPYLIKFFFKSSKHSIRNCALNAAKQSIIPIYKSKKFISKLVLLLYNITSSFGESERISGGEKARIDAVNGQNHMGGKPGLVQSFIVQHSEIIPEPNNCGPFASPGS